jgi:hypothetical protein
MQVFHGCYKLANECHIELFQRSNVVKNVQQRELETLEEADFAMDEDVYNIITYRVMLF